MNWIKKGLIYKPTGEWDFSKTHAQVPFAFKLDDETLRIFFGTRDSQSSTGTTFLDVDINNPASIKYIHDKACLSKGKPGYFDDSGTMPAWFLPDGERLLLYYTAWNKSSTASYRLSIGLAESFDNGLTFNKLFEGPILDRNKFDAIWVGQPCVIKEGDMWRMWYLACTKIEYIYNHPEPFYNVKYAESKNGIDWTRENITCIDYSENTDAIGRPCVFKEDNLYKMFYSYRKATDYRSDPQKSYSMGYAESKDGIVWQRKDDEIDLTSGENDWDSMMQEYATTYAHNGKRYLIYNGNGFGRTGFGYAVQE